MGRKANNQLRSFGAKLLVVGAIVVAAGLAYLFLTPKSYEASVRIRLRNWVHSSTTNEEQGVDVPAQLQLIRSDAVLDETIHNLGLNELWGKSLNPGAPLKTEQSRLLLKTRLEAHRGPRANLIEIGVTGSDPDEIAKIANEIARIYQDKRQTQGHSLNAERLAQLKTNWDEQGKKVREAQVGVEKLYVEITQNRATNPAAAHDIILARRIKIEGEYNAQHDELVRLQALKPEQLRQVLPMLETNTNSILTKALAQRSKARIDLIAAQSTYATNSPEVKNANAILAEVDKSIDGAIAGIMAGREKQVESLKAALNEANEKLKLTGTNSNEIAEQDAAYARAQQNLTNLIAERDLLQERIFEAEANEAMMPTMVVPEIIDSAYPPRKPAVPDGRIAVATIGAGLLAIIVGAIALLTPVKPPPPRRL